MAELATVTGIVSLVDVARRACSALCDSIGYIKDAPDLSQRLQRSIKSIESVLQSLNLFIAQYRQTTTLAAQPDQLPAAVSHELIAIKTALDALATLLPATISGSKLRKGIRTILDRKQVVEVTQRLDSHQITLILALQTFTQKNGVKVHENLIHSLEEACRQHQDAHNDLRGELGSVSAGLNDKLDFVTQTSTQALLAQETLDTSFKGLSGLISAGHDTLNDKLNSLQIFLAETKLQGSQVRSSTVLTAPTEDVLARVFRAELRRVIMPTVKQCFDTYKSNPDSQLDEIRRRIDEMAQQLGSNTCADTRDPGITSSQTLPEAVHGSGQTHPDVIGVTAAGSMKATSFSKIANGIEGNARSVRYRKRSWVFKWAIGTLWVTFSASVTKRKAPVFRVGHVPFSEQAYRVTIDFQPAQSLVLLRGLTMSVASSQDQRGYYPICPFLSTFAVVSFYAEVMLYASHNNIEGLQDLFARRLAAPSDGWTAEWFEALERAGYDLDEVEEETRRRQWLFDNPGDAFFRHSGVDRDLVAPSREGLVLRRAIVGDRLDE